MDCSCIPFIIMISSSCLLKSGSILDSLLKMKCLVAQALPTFILSSSLCFRLFCIIFIRIFMFGQQIVIFPVSNDGLVVNKMYLFMVIYSNFLHFLSEIQCWELLAVYHRLIRSHLGQYWSPLFFIRLQTTIFDLKVKLFLYPFCKVFQNYHYYDSIPDS